MREAIGILKPGDAQWMRSMDGAALTVVLKDGSYTIFKAILTCFDEEDLEWFFHELIERNPQFGVPRHAP